MGCGCAVCGLSRLRGARALGRLGARVLRSRAELQRLRVAADAQMAECAASGAAAAAFDLRAHASPVPSRFTARASRFVGCRALEPCLGPRVGRGVGGRASRTTAVACEDRGRPRPRPAAHGCKPRSAEAAPPATGHESEVREESGRQTRRSQAGGAGRMREGGTVSIRKSAASLGLAARVRSFPAAACCSGH